MPLLTCTQTQLLASLQSAAAVEALLTADDKRYLYESDWKPGVDFAMFTNGSGDDMFILASRDGVIIQGFDHESQVSPYHRADHSPWPGMYAGVPTELQRLLEGLAFGQKDITFLHWLSANQTEWCRGEVSFANGEQDGSEWMLGMLPLSASAYIEGARDYFEDDFDKLDPSVIHQLFAKPGTSPPPA